uniref:Uncharacterized protein n=1 Tax=Populus trichocarpa TaxID=3694 RepID=A0A2K2BDV6_POPTR
MHRHMGCELHVKVTRHLSVLCTAKLPWGLVLLDVSCGNGSVPVGQRTTCCLLVTREFWDPMLQIYYNLSRGRTCHHK